MFTAPGEERDDQQKLLLDVIDEQEEDGAPAAPIRKKRQRWLRRADAVCLAIVGFAACYVMIWQPPIRQENPFLIPHAEHQQRQDNYAPAASQHAAEENGDGNAKYMTYADIDQAKRKHGYAVTHTQRGFEIDGQRTLLLGGSIHYPRSTPGMWEDLLRKAKDDGLNHIQMCTCACYIHRSVACLWFRGCCCRCLLESP